MKKLVSLGKGIWEFFVLFLQLFFVSLKLYRDKKLPRRGNTYFKENKTETSRGHTGPCPPKCPLSTPLPRKHPTPLSLRIAII